MSTVLLLVLIINVIGSAMAKETQESPKVEEKAEKPTLAKVESEAMRQSDKGDEVEEEEMKTDSSGFPTTLSGFGYAFNDKGELRHIETEKPFEFMVSDNMKHNQKNYEALGEVITETVYELLESKGNLKKHYIPVGANEKKSARSFIFLSEDALTNADKLMILIHGNGVVRAGQWTRKLIINEDLDHGTQLPYIKKAMEEGYGVIVLNTNLNSVQVNGSPKKVKDNDNPEHHGKYVWKNFVKKSKAKHIAIVAHSYGGVVTASLASEFKSDFEKKVFAVAFTDSVHSGFISSTVGKLFAQRAVNWVTSDKPRDTLIRENRADAKRVSAGHEKHEWTSWAAFESVFEFFSERLQQFTKSNRTPSPQKTKGKSPKKKKVPTATLR